MGHSNQGFTSFVDARKSLWQRILCHWADKIEVGRLTIYFPGGGEYVATGSMPGPSAAILLKNARPVYWLLTGGALGFARSHIDGDFETPDLGALLELALANENAFRSIMEPSAILAKFAYLRHCLRRNTKAGSRRNISFHYDLGNDFYGLWLDETMTYSSALFETPDQSLSQAQEAKYARILRELEIGPTDHVLEIGSGWGGFAEYAIRKTGCRVTGLTLSTEQASFARARLDKAGFADRFDIRLEDYRDCRGEFDKVVSIEMFEAVGEENWQAYFETVRKRLAPGGRAMVQTITIAGSCFEQYRKNADFIQTYIFPGGMLPSVPSFRSMAEACGMRVREMFGFGKDYNRTLLSWDSAFTSNWQKIAALGFDSRFYRMWRYYLQYCAAGFRTGRIDVVQFHLERA